MKQWVETQIMRWMASPSLANNRIVLYFVDLWKRAEQQRLDCRLNRLLEDELEKFKGACERDVIIATTLLTNQLNYIRQSRHHCASSQPIGANIDTARVMMRVAGRAIREFIGLSPIVGLQPLQGPVGVAYSMHTAAGSGDSDDASPQTMNVSVQKHTVEAGSRKLQACLTMEAVQDLSMFGVDVEHELMSLLGSEIGFEYANEFIHDLCRIAAHKSVVKLSDILEKPDLLSVRINGLCNAIATKTRRGPGNFVVVSPAILAMLQATPGSSFEPSPASTPRSMSGLMFVGMLNETIRVYCSLCSSVDATVLIGYKGNQSEIDAGYFFHPFVPVMTTGIVADPMTFQPKMMLMTRYAKSTFTQTDSDICGSADYYAVLTIAGMDGMTR